MTTLSVLIPTLGRTSLGRAVQSVLMQLGPEDELIVVADGPSNPARRTMLDAWDKRARYVETHPTRIWGAYQYDIGASMARGDFLVHLPDDDYMAVGAIEKIRERVSKLPPGVHVFSFLEEHSGGKIFYGRMEAGEVSGNQIVVPRLPHRAVWSDDTKDTFDHSYLHRAMVLWGQTRPYYSRDIIAVADVCSRGRML